MVSIQAIFLGIFIFISFLVYCILGTFSIKTIIPPALVGYEMIIVSFSLT